MVESDSEMSQSSLSSPRGKTEPGSPPVSPGPLSKMAMLNTPLSARPPKQQVPGAPMRKTVGSDTSSDSEGFLWGTMPRPRRLRTAYERRSRSMCDLSAPAPAAAEPVPPVAPAPAPTAPVVGFKNVMILDIDGVSNSFAAILALDTFVFLVAWAPFSLYGALFFVVTQRVSLALLERYVCKAVLR